MSAPKPSKLSIYSKTVRYHGVGGITGAMGGRRASGTGLFVRGGGAAPPEVRNQRSPRRQVWSRCNLQQNVSAAGYFVGGITCPMFADRPAEAAEWPLAQACIVVWLVSSCNCWPTSFETKVNNRFLNIKSFKKRFFHNCNKKRFLKSFILHNVHNRQSSRYIIYTRFEWRFDINYQLH